MREKRGRRRRRVRGFSKLITRRNRETDSDYLHVFISKRIGILSKRANIFATKHDSTARFDVAKHLLPHLTQKTLQRTVQCTHTEYLSLFTWVHMHHPLLSHYSRTPFRNKTRVLLCSKLIWEHHVKAAILIKRRGQYEFRPSLMPLPASKVSKVCFFSSCQSEGVSGGESPTPLSLSSSKILSILKKSLLLKVGGEAKSKGIGIRASWHLLDD